MRRVLRVVAVTWLSTGLFGCGSELTTAGSHVDVGKGAPDGSKCRELGIVYGSGSGAGYTSAQTKLEWAQNELRNKTAELGGNFVIMDASAGDAGSITMSGRALSCTEAPVGSAVAVPSAAAAEVKPISAAPSHEGTPEERLRVLDDLHQKGLVTDAEYQQRRQQIINSL